MKTGTDLLLVLLDQTPENTAVISNYCMNYEHLGPKKENAKIDILFAQIQLCLTRDLHHLRMNFILEEKSTFPLYEFHVASHS